MKTPDKRRKHGYSTKGDVSSEYGAWRSIKNRCHNPKYHQYYLYGGRGIKVCERWFNSFENFISDMGDKPSKNHSIDRIKVDGDYEPNNCRWATELEQQRNRRSNRWIEHDGKRMILKEWADYLGTRPPAIITMLKKKSFSEVVNYYQS